VKGQFVRRLRRYLMAGLLVWLPLGVTYLAFKFVLDAMDQLLPLLPARYQPDALLGFHIPGFGVILALVVLLTTGLLVANLIGRTLVSWWEDLLNRIPLVRSIYSGVKGFTETLVSNTGGGFRKVVLIEYPRRGMWSIAFVTASGLAEIDAKTGAEQVCVFIPTTPNPTSGFIFLIPAAELIELDMSVDAAMKMIVTLGVVVPPSMRPLQKLPGAPE
jgi:uncharacterized membrane protein